MNTPSASIVTEKTIGGNFEQQGGAAEERLRSNDVCGTNRKFRLKSDEESLTQGSKTA